MVDVVVPHVAARVAATEQRATEPRLPLVLRVPTDRRRDNHGDRLNIGTSHTEVEVVIDPDLDTFGLHEPAYGRETIRLREWNEQVFLHELLHVAIGRVVPRGEGDPHGHDIISRVEVALWETGWRFRPEAEDRARADEHRVGQAVYDFLRGFTGWSVPLPSPALIAACIARSEADTTGGES